MDPISATGLAAALVQLIGIAVKIIETLNEIRNAPQDRARLALEATSLLGLLTTLRYRVEDSSQSDLELTSIRMLGAENGPLDQLKDLLEGIADKLHRSHGATKIAQLVVWPLDRRAVEHYLDKIERLKSLISLAVQNDTLELAIAIKADTETIHKLAGDVHQVSARLKAHSAAQSRHDAEEAREQMLKWLSPLNFHTVQEDIFNRRQEGTGESLLHSSVFQKWVNNPSPQSLWCYGIPGAGKTITSSVVVEHLRTLFRPMPNVGIAYIYCNYKDRAIQTSTRLVTSLWSQLIASEGPLSTTIRRTYKETHKKRGTRMSLWEITQEFYAEAQKQDKTFIVIDALDECSEGDGVRKALVNLIKQAPVKLNVLITSRLLDSINDSLSDWKKFEIGATDKDVRLYVKARIVDEARLSRHCFRDPGLQSAIVKKIVCNSQKMFLLAQLHINSLATKATPRHVYEALEKLPSELDETYHEAMERINNQNEDDRILAHRILSWVSSAQRPLSMEELLYMTSIEKGDRSLDKQDILDSDMVTSVCAGLIKLQHASNEVQLVHYTTQDYFERFAINILPQARGYIMSTCLTYLAFDECTKLWKRFLHKTKSRYSEFRDPSYIGRYWNHHIFEPEDKDLRDTLLKFLRDGEKVSLAMTLKSKWAFTLRLKATGLHLAASMGMEGVVSQLLKDGCEAGAQDGDRKTPLHKAAKRGYEGVIAMLLNASQPNVRATNLKEYTALHYAARQGSPISVDLIIRAGALVDAQNQFGRASIHEAVLREHPEVVQVLLQHGARVDISANDGTTPLHTASQIGNSAITRLLLEAGAKPDQRDVRHTLDGTGKKRIGSNALHYAAETGNVETVSLLLSHIVDIDALDGDGWSPLWYAVSSGQLPLVETLIKNGADVGVRDPSGSTLLHAAAALDDASVIEVLLDRCPQLHVEIRTANKLGIEPLLLAMQRSDDRVVTLLLEKARALDPNVKDEYGNTPLHLAARDGDLEQIGRFCKLGLSVQARNNYGEAPLHRAAENGHADATELLIRKESNLLATDLDGETALHRAVGMAHPQVVQTILNCGYNTKLAIARDYKDRTALQRARHVEVLHTLLQVEAFRNTIDARDEYGRPVLIWVAEQGYAEVVEVLLEHGADVNVQDHSGEAALNRAAANGHEVIVGLLLSAGADVHLTDEDGETALDQARRGDYSRIVGMLANHESPLI